MKKLLVMAIAMIATLAASAQAYTGGAIGFMRNTSANKTTFTIAPELGFNLSDTWAIGGVVDFSYLKTKEGHSTMFEIDPYARYTFYKADNSKLKLFIDGGVDLGFGSSKLKGESSGTAVSFGIGLNPGVSYALSDNFSLVAHLGFLGYKGGNDKYKQLHDEVFGFDFSTMNLSFGFYYNF